MLAAIFYVVLKFVVLAIEFQSFAIKGIINAAPQIAPLVAFVILIPAPVAAFNAWRKRILLHSQKDLNSVRSPSTVKRPISTGHIQARKPNYTATNIKRDTFRHFVPIAIPQSRVEAGFKPAPTGWRAVPPYVGSQLYQVRGAKAFLERAGVKP